MDFHLIELDFTPDVPALLARLGLDADSDEAADFTALLDRIVPLTHPKAALGTAAVERADAGGEVTLGGVKFRSQLLAKNLAGVKTVWPHLATAGREVHDFAQALPNPFERYWVEEIMQAALGAVREALEAHLREKVYAGKTGSMGPGSLPEWPIGEQAALFKLLGDAAPACGVELTDSLVMLPGKSVSGLFFPNEHGFVSCKLCPRERCPNRKAEYEGTAGMQTRPHL